MKYCGIILLGHGDLEKEVCEQIIKENRVVECLSDTIWRNKHICTDTKMRIYKMVIGQ